MKRQILLCSCAAFLLITLGCGPKMMFPPEVELREYGSVGLIEFTSNYEGNLGTFVTQRFLEEVNDAQKDARIVELGDIDSVLQSVEGDDINPNTVQAIGQKYNVNAVIIGNLDVSRVKPKVSISSIITSMSVKAEVEAALTAKLVETNDGATIWTNSVRGKMDVAHVSIFPGGNVHFDANDPKEAYGDLAEEMINEITEDFRVTYKRHRGR